MGVNAKDLKELTKKVDVIANLVQLCQKNFKFCSDKVNDLESKCEQLEEIVEFKVIEKMNNLQVIYDMLK